MSFKLMSAYVELSNRGFSGVMGGIASIGSRLAALGPVAIVTGGAIAAIGAAKSLSGFVQLAANLEQTETRFKTLLGSADAAKKMVEDLSKFAASTPFQMEGLSQTAQTLLAFGVSQDQIIPTMQALGDVAAASGADINELGNIYGKVRANGRLMTESLDQFNERAIPVGATLAKLFGKTEAEIRQMASKGEISFGDLQRAMVSMTSEGGMAFGGMESQSKTLGGLWSTLTDNITLAMTDIGTALVEGFDLKGVTAYITEFTDRVRGEWLPSIVAGFRWLSQNMITPVLMGWRMMADGLFDFISNFDLYWTLASAHIANFALNSYERVKTMFINMMEIADWAWNNWDQYLEIVRNNTINLFNNITQNVMAVWQALLDWVAGQGFSPDFKPMLQGVKMLWEVIPEMTRANLDQLQPDIDRVYAQLNRRREEAAEREAARRATGAAAALAIEGVPAAPGDAPGGGGAKSDRAAFVGLAQLAEQMQAQAGAAQDAKRQAEAAEAAARAGERVAAKAEGDGLRVHVVGQSNAAAPEINLAFGGG